jgi:hypothetical protein
MKSFLILTSVLCLITYGSYAHPGHGVMQDSVWHYIFSPMHLIPILVAIGLFLLYRIFKLNDQEIKEKKDHA